MSSSHNKSSALSLLPLLMVILIDVAGIVLIMPVLAPLILQSNSGLVSPQMSIFLRDCLYGLSMALFPLFMFFSTPILGDLSDKFGRKRLLMICLGMAALGNLLSALGIILHNLLLFLVSRAVAGLAAGTQPIATAAVIDLATPQNKTKYLAWVVLTCSLGVILGPLLGGITAEHHLVSWFSYDTPFLFTTGLACLNAALLYVTLPATPPQQAHQAIQLTKGFRLFLTAFKEKRFALLSMLYLCFLLAWSLYYQTINWFFMATYHYSVLKLGLFTAFIGVMFAMASTFMKRILSLFKTENHTFRFSVCIMAIANFAAAVSHNEISQWLWVILNAGSDAVCYTVALAIYSSLVSHDSQGWIMGVTGAIMAVSWAIGGLITGPLGYISVVAPFWTAGVLCLVSFALMMGYMRGRP